MYFFKIGSRLTARMGQHHQPADTVADEGPYLGNRTFRITMHSKRRIDGICQILQCIKQGTVQVKDHCLIMFHQITSRYICFLTILYSSPMLK